MSDIKNVKLRVDNRSKHVTIKARQHDCHCMPFQELHQIKPYLYEVWYNKIDYEYAYRYFRKSGDFPVGACSSLRNGNFFGRNLDWTYDEEAEFIVHTPRIADRYAVAGVCGGVKELTDAFVQSGEMSDIYKILPFRMYDGENEFKVFASVNVVPTDKGTSIIEPIQECLLEICSSMLIRYVLEHFKTALEAVTYIRNHMRIYFSKALHDMDYEAHFMIGDPTSNYVVEFVEGRTVILERNVMTNFHLHGVEFNDDGTVYTPETQDETHNAMDTNRITAHGSGLERYNLIISSYASLNTEAGMRAMLNSLMYTKAYITSPAPSSPYWYTEFVGGELNCASDVSDFAEIVELAGKAYSRRSRNIPQTWQTVHSIVYDIDGLCGNVIVQETGEAYHFEVTGGRGEEYDGDYEVVPKPRIAQRLETKDKYMKDDVVVFEIPYFETSNPQGKTVYIGQIGE